jgi:hypothetical protein
VLVGVHWVLAKLPSIDDFTVFKTKLLWIASSCSSDDESLMNACRYKDKVFANKDSTKDDDGSKVGMLFDCNEVDGVGDGSSNTESTYQEITTEDVGLRVGSRE